MTLLERRLLRAPYAHVALMTRQNHLATASSLAVFAFASILLGCGLTINSPAGSNPGQSAGSAGGSGSSGDGGPPGGQTVPTPRALQAFTGCTNPNTGVSSGDWGVATSPVYTTVNNTSPIVGTPIYKSNAIFWTSRENAPGQSILVTGAFTDAKKNARLALIPPGTTDWQTLVRGSSTVVPTTQQGTTGLSFIIPSTFSAGVYAFEIDDPSAPPVLGLANVPALNWAIGVPSITDSATALQHQVYDCGVEQGGVLRLFGKNFVASDQVVLQSSSGVPYLLKVSKIDSNSVAASVPSTLAAGTYNVWVGTSPWSAVSSPAAQITIHAPSPLSVRKVNCSHLVGDGVTDNTKSLQTCLDVNAPIGSREVAYFNIPPGKFVLTGMITGHPYEVLIGSSPTATRFVGRPTGPPPAAWFAVPQYFGLTDLALEAPANPNLFRSSGTTTGNPMTSGHLFFNNIDFESTSDASNGAEVMFLLAGPDIQVYNSYFLSNSNEVFYILFGDGGIVSGNHMVLNNWTGLAIGDSQNMIFETNLIDSQNQPGQGNGNHSGGSGLSIGRSNNIYGQSRLSRNIYAGYNKFQNMGSGDQQAITNDGDGGAYLGPVAQSTTDTITLANDPNWNWMGTTNPQASVMAIVFGTGVGQYSFLKSYSGRTINLSTPLKVLPDATSVIVISQYELNMTIAHNAFTNTLGDTIVLGDALEGVIEDNTLTNAGGGILISAFGPYGGPAAYGPVMNTDVLRNTITPGDGNFIFRDASPYLWGIGIQDFPGCSVSGLMIRNNTVTPINTIYSTDGVNGISAVVVEQNQALWAPSFSTPGFLIQDNSPPPG